MTKKKICPICESEYSQYPALARCDNKTDICSDCGSFEAMLNYYKTFPADIWELKAYWLRAHPSIRKGFNAIAKAPDPGAEGQSNANPK